MRRRALVALAVLGILAGCRKSKPGVPSAPPPEVTGLAAVPSTADIIIGLDAGRLADSPIVMRAIEMLLAREPDLATRWQALRTSCKLEIKNVNRLMLALGPPPPGGRLGTGPLVMIATGKISEPDLVGCVREIVGKGGGSLIVKESGGRSLYHVKDGARAIYIAFGRTDTVILGNHEAYVLEAVGNGQKALDQPELAGWLKLADQNAPIWVVGRVPERLKDGLIRASNNMLKAGAKAFIGAVDLTSGVDGELVALMESPGDAKQLESLVNMNLIGLSWAAQRAALAKVVQKLSIKAKGATVEIRAPLTMGDVNDVLSGLDEEKAPPQDSPPAGGSATTSPALPPR